jgi:soluble lytic murein transglycosylase-like protein
MALRTRRFLIACLFAVLCLPGAARATVSHTVEPGETLWSIATANGLTPAEVAAANGLSPDARVIAGTEISIPTGSGGTGAAAGPGPSGAYVVQLGDTLTGIAARSNVSVEAVAAMNGIDPDAPLLAGTALKLPSGTAPQASTQAPTHVTNAAPHPTAEHVDASTIGQVAAAHGVPPSLAAAIAWQESGFDNSVVSDSNARGVMQIVPGTWSWVNSNLAGPPLDPSSAMGNVEAGVLYLGQLLHDTGGDPALAVAAYYQGLGSVREIGMLPSTRRYVANVLALRARFGG